ncbi:hypothetical protein RvY_08840 [Ramazzottius varieornatus]|uniref:Uncharacterized protein n=1 Tax=Ramazzottius varieornatus TaxID=947166 RepID=A0A1D1V9V4_RAMVA|nr:hypothetical protein RvY_08840 [Ramazzottius varieornatus]
MRRQVHKNMHAHQIAINQEVRKSSVVQNRACIPGNKYYGPSGPPSNFSPCILRCHLPWFARRMSD